MIWRCSKTRQGPQPGSSFLQMSWIIWSEILRRCYVLSCLLAWGACSWSSAHSRRFVCTCVYCQRDWVLWCCGAVSIGTLWASDILFAVVGAQKVTLLWVSLSNVTLSLSRFSRASSKGLATILLSSGLAAGFCSGLLLPKPYKKQCAVMKPTYKAHCTIIKTP